MAELADARDLKSLGPKARAGSTPASGTVGAPAPCPARSSEQAATINTASTEAKHAPGNLKRSIGPKDIPSTGHGHLEQ